MRQYSRKIQLKSQEAIHIIDADKVIFMRQEGESTLIIKEDHSFFTVPFPISNIEKELAGFPFWRTDKHHLVNLNYLRRIPSAGNNTISLSKGYSVPIDNDRMVMLLEVLSDYYK